MKKSFYIFGGSFDPVHNGHLEISRAIANAKGIQKITLMPSAIPAHCNKMASKATTAQRLEMLRLAIIDDDLFEVCDLELKLATPSYTIDTVNKLREIHGENTKITWIIGADMLADLPNWKNAAKLMKEIDFLVACRSPWQGRFDEILQDIENRLGTIARVKLESAFVPTPLVNISSTEIRQRVKRGEDFSDLVPSGVSEFVSLQGLYK